jgi:6-phosphofructokinase 1
VPVNEVAAAVEDAYRRGKRHAIIVVAEGFEPHTTDLARMIDELDIGFKTRVTILGHIQRGGSPTAFDRMLASQFGVKAVELLLDGQSNVMTGLNGREITGVPLPDVNNNLKRLPTEYYEMARMLAR